MRVTCSRYVTGDSDCVNVSLLKQRSKYIESTSNLYSPRAGAREAQASSQCSPSKFIACKLS